MHSTFIAPQRKRRLSRVVPGLLAMTLAAGACTSDDPDVGSVDLDPSNVSLTSGLTTVNSCDALLDRLIAEGLERVGPYGFDSGQYRGGWLEGGVDFAMDDAMEESASFDTGAAQPVTTVQASESAKAEGADGSFSGTNNQEGGVDEGDFVKTDGERLIVANSNVIRVIDTTTDQPQLVHNITLSEQVWPREMFLVGDRLLVLSHGWIDVDYSDSQLLDELWTSRPGGTSTTSLTEIDLNSGTVGDTITFQGDYLSGREVDGTIRLVVNANVGQFPFVYPNGAAAEETAENANRELLKNSTIDQWMPQYATKDGAAGDLIPCDQMHIPSTFSGFGTLGVLTVNLNGDGDLGLADSLGVLTTGNTIYASTERLTVATTRWDGDFQFDEDTGMPVDNAYTTALHNFDISDPANTAYVGSGTIDGFLLSQYSMSEHNGFLRVAATEGAPWGDDASESAVIILEEQGNELVVVGKVGGLGKGEQIQSVRFMGDVGYVVTFRQVDPLYTVDLSEPTNPTLLGELKIPGFSAYLHPIEDGKLLGIGQDGTDDGRLTGAQVSMFDVSDLTNPTRVATLGFGENSNSSVGWEPKAFTWWAPTRTAFVPVNAWNYDDGNESNSADVVAVRIGEDGSLTEAGRMSHPAFSDCEIYYLEGDLIIEEDSMQEATATEDGADAEAGLLESSEPAPAQIEPTSPSRPDGPVEEYCWSYQPEISRTIVIGDSVYTVSDGGVMASSLADFSEQSWITFERN